MNLKYSEFAFAFLALAPLAAANDDRTCGTPRLQTDYRGDISTTLSGRTCQAWTSQSPHRHGNTPQNRPGKGIGAHNACRNPDGESDGVWCYTTDPAKRWEYCGVPDCTDVTMPTLAPTAFPDSPPTPEQIAEAYSGPVTGVCRNAANGVNPDRFYVDGLFASDADGPSTCANLCAPFEDAPGFVGMQWRSVSTSGGARCICFFDDGYVPTTLPAGSTTNTDNTSVGPITGDGMADHYCFPFKGYMDAARRAIYGDNGPLTDFVDFEVYGAPLQVANVEKPYDQNQNYPGQVAPTFSDDHTTITADGNTWSSYLLPQEILIHKDSVLQFDFLLEEDTVEGFQAVCLDEDTEETGNNGKCFVLRSSQGWITDMINVPTQGGLNELSSHSIPVGDFFTGPVNYLVFIQDSDGQDRSLGKSSLSGLKLISLESDQLEIEIDDVNQFLGNNQVSYTRDGEAPDFQDEEDFWMHLSEDHKAVQINGNQWKALPLNDPYEVTASTVLEFDIVLTQSVDFHAVCLDADVSASGDECVVVQSPVDHLGNFHHLTTKLETGVPTHLVIPFGSFMRLGADEKVSVNYIAFIQDNDQTDRHAGRSTWSNLRLYESERHDIEISVFGESVVVPNIQGALSRDNNDNQDSRDHILSVSAPSEGGSTVTATGNSWKYLTLPEPLTVTPATVLRFTFALLQESEIHGICLLKATDTIKDGRNDCYFTAGRETSLSGMGLKVEPYTEEGQVSTYEILAGSYFTGKVNYLGFILDNDLEYDVERTAGQSSWSNIEIYDLPSLDISLDGSLVSIENNQISYESASQDNTPIRDYMATISDDGAINLVGNMWRALELPTPLSPTYLQDFVVSFDFTLDEAGEIHAICFDENLEYGNANDPNNPDPRRCVSTAYFQEIGNLPDLDVLLADFQTRPGESHRYVLNLSKMFDKLYINESGDPTPAPTPPISLADVGNNGSPSSAFPLGLCEGDCDNDGECAPGLKCFQRSALQPVPGCEGLGKSNWDYCYDPYPKEFNIKYIAFVNDNDDDNSVGDATYGNIAITTSLSSCLSGQDFDFQLSDCTINNFLGKVETVMSNKGCDSTDALLELFAIFDATQEADVYKQIEKICTSAYKLDQYDFADGTLATDEALERQLVKEYIDGGTVMNYEAEADSAVKIGRVNDKFASSRVLTMPKHHALDRCDIGAAMCCFTDSRTVLADNSDVCYVNMKASRYTAHVRDGYSIYGDEPVYCEGFAWGNDGGISSALKGNALFKVGFMDNFSSGRVEQVPGAPLCGCMDRMPVVTKAACTDVKAPSAIVSVQFDSGAGVFDAELSLGEVQYGNCDGLDLVEHYGALVDQGKASPADAAYMGKRIVGEGGCGAAINDFLSRKGLTKS